MEERWEEAQASAGRVEAGVATLGVTVVLLMMALLAALVVGRVGLWEQQRTGTDVRSKEVYAAAAGGLEYAVNWLERLARDSHISSDSQLLLNPDRWEEGFLGAGARLLINAHRNADWLPAGTVQLADAEHELYPTAMTADEYEYEWAYTALTPLDDPSLQALVIEVAVTARALGDTHIQKTVGVDVVMGFSPLFPWSGDVFSAPPLIVEACISGDVNGLPEITLSGSPALATTLMESDTSLPDCLPAAGFIECVQSQLGGPPSSCSPLSPAQVGLSQPAGSLWSTLFGDITRSELKAVADRHPDRVLWVNEELSHPGWSGDQWQLSVGDAQDPVILFFDHSVGCPPISGHVQVHGIVYFENPDCEMHRWESGALHGTLAVAGTLHNLEASVGLLAADLDFASDLLDPRFSWTYRLHYFAIPGSWRDFGF